VTASRSRSTPAATRSPAASAGSAARSLARLASPPSREQADTQPPAVEDAARLLRTATAEDPELGLFLRLAVVLGARRGELCALRWSEVDPNQGEVLIAGAVVRRLARRLGVRARLHDLRHFMVTQLVAGGVDWRTVSGRAGHADGHMTLATYAHFQQAQDRQAAEFMESLLAPPARPDARLR